MGYDRNIADELRALKPETLHARNANTQRSHATSPETAYSLVAGVKTFLTDLRDALSRDEAEVERAFAGRVAATMVTALVAGVVLGYLAKRKP